MKALGKTDEEITLTRLALLKDLANKRAEHFKAAQRLYKKDSEEYKASQDAKKKADEDYRSALNDTANHLRSLASAYNDAAFKARQLAAQQAYVDAKRAINDYEVQIEQTKLEALAAVTNGLSGLLEELGEDNKTFAVLSKTLALAEIAINTGKAIAAGTAQAQSVPFPGNLIAIATTVATIMANITSAIKTVKSAKFSTGGYVSGPGTSTSDSIPAMLSDGESVNAALPTSMFAPIYSALNQLGGGAPIVAAQSSNQIAGEAVSYTHLTLPTTSRV